MSFLGDSSAAPQNDVDIFKKWIPRFALNDKKKILKQVQNDVDIFTVFGVKSAISIF
jgi:hypothetical protein